ncbi:carbon storage regulator [Hahella sp. SMD15-11]|uniref:Carbon storage regulator n=1 Tax=Thermohahella caldifontis TaxID=3142973 RepID=A0AB39UTF2_9GAMM
MTLILSRRAQQDIRIGPDTRIRILAVSGENVLLGIEAKPGIRILRQELDDTFVAGRAPSRSHRKKTAQCNDTDA